MKKRFLSSFLILSSCAHAAPEFTADVLFWNAQQSGAENWGQIFTPGNIDLLPVHFGTSPGFRFGLGQFSYTRFQTTGHGAAHSDGIVTSAFLGNFFVNNPAGISDSGPTYHDACIAWRITYNVLDWELAKTYKFMHDCSIRPAIGLKWGLIKQKINTAWAHPNESQLKAASNFSHATENLENNFIGIGPSVGLNSSWKLGTFYDCPVYLFGNASAALMWARWSFADAYKNDIGQQVIIDLPTFKSAAATFRTYFGLKWGPFHAGYELQFWLNQLQSYFFNGGILNNELTLQGGTIGVTFEL